MTAAPQTILYLDHTARLSGGEIALLNLLTALDKTRFRPLVLLASDGPLVGKLYAAGIETHVLPLDAALLETRKESLHAGGLLGRMRQIGTLWAYARQVARWARVHDAVLLHANSLKSDVYGGLAGRMARLPVLWHVRDRLADGYLPRTAAIGFRLLARCLPQVVVTNSESTLRTLRLSPRKRSAVVYSGVTHTAGPRPRGAQVVYDGVPAEQFAPPENGPVSTGGPIISLFGRISPWKGQHVFLDAAAQVLSVHPKARFRIVGAPLFDEHEYERSLHEQAARLGIAANVEFLGFREDIPALLTETDIVVHASTLGEPFGQVVVEGMAAGKPVIASDGGALPEIMEDGLTGLLTPMGDAPALARAVLALLQDPARAAALGLAGQARVRERFTIERSARAIEAVYAALLPPVMLTANQPLPQKRTATP